MKSYIIPIVALFGVAFSLAHGQLQFLDTFDTDAGIDQNDVNFGYTQAGRQSGALADLQYYQGRNGTGVAPANAGSEVEPALTRLDATNDALRLVAGGNQYTAVSLDYNFDAALSAGQYLSVSFDLNPDDADGWGGILLGASDNANFGTAGTGARGQFINTSVAHFGFLLGNGGNWQAFDGDSQPAGYTGTAAAFTGAANVEVRIRGVGGIAYAWDGSDADITVLVNGSSVFDETVGGGFVDNYITLESYSFNYGEHVFDNFQVSVVPEPSTFAILAGCFGLTYVMLKRRRVV